MRKSVIAGSVAAVGMAAATAIGTTVALASNTAPSEHFSFLSSRANAAPVVIAQGPIHARGKDVAVSNTKDRIEFRAGNLIIRHHRTGQGVQTFDRKTCFGHYREFGTYRIVRGTGAYRGVAGHGTYRLSVKTVGCSQSNPPRVFLLDIEASGPIHS